MKRTQSIIFVALVVFGIGLLAGCDSPTGFISDIPVEIFLTDLNGAPITSVRTGEEFYVNVKVTNRTDSRRYFSYTPPEFIYKIMVRDSLIMASYEGYYYPQVVIQGYLDKDSSIVDRWLAPRSPSRPAFILAPGVYMLNVSMGATWVDRDYLPETKKYFIVTQ